MPGTVNTNGRRKVRCPKCTACLTEPPIPIYQCPICSTLLLAKGSAGDTKCELSPGNEEDAESIHPKSEGGRLKPETGTVICEPNKIVETTQSTPVGRSKQENAPTIHEPSEKQGQQGIDLIREEVKSLKEEEEYEQGGCTVRNDLSGKQGLQGLDNVEKERTSFEGDSSRSHIPPVDGNASESCGRLRDSNVESVQQKIERWAKLEKDALAYETNKTPTLGGRKYLKTECATPDRVEGHAFEFDVTDSCDATQDVQSGNIGRDAENIAQTSDRPDKDAERMHQTVEGFSELENATVRCDPSQKQGQQGMDYMGKERVPLEGKGGSEQENATLIDDPRTKDHRQGRDYCEMELESSKGDNGLLHSSAGEGSLDDSHATLTGNFPQGSCIDAESIKQMPHHWSKLEIDALIEEPRKKLSHQEMEFVEKGSEKPERFEGCEFEVDVTDNHDALQQSSKNGSVGRDAEIDGNRNSEIEGHVLEFDVTENHETSQQVVSGNYGRDAEEIQHTCKGRSDPIENVEVLQQTQEGGSNQENVVIHCPRKTKEQLGMNYVEEECKSSERDGESKQESTTNLSKKQEQQGMDYVEKDPVTSVPCNGQNLGMDCMENESAESDGVVGLTLKFDRTDSYEATDELVSGCNGEDPESTHSTLEGGSKHDKDSGIIQETLDEGCQEENATVINYPVEKQGQLGLDHMEKELKPFGEEGGCPEQEKATIVIDPREKQEQLETDAVAKEHESLEEVGESKQEGASAINNPSKKHGQQGVDCMEKEGRSFEEPNKLLHISSVEGNPNNSHHRLTQTFLHEKYVDPEMPGWMSNVEKDAIISELSERKRPQGVMHTEKLSAVPYGVQGQDIAFDATDDSEAPHHLDVSHKGRDAESIRQAPKEVCTPEKTRDMFQGTLDAGSKKENASVINDSNRKQRQGMDILQECKSFDKDSTLLHHSTVKESPGDSNGRSTKNSGYENCFASECIKSVAEIDRDSIINKQRQGMEYMEEESALSYRIEVRDSDLGVIDYGEATKQEMSGYNGRELSRAALFHEEDTDKEASFMIKESDLDCGSTNNAEAETTNIIESSVVPKAVTQSIMDSLGDPGHPISDRDPSEVADISHLDKSCGSLTKSGLSVSKGASIGTDEEAMCGNQMRQEVSKCPKQQLHGGDVVNAVFVDKDEEGNYREQGSAAFLSRLIDVPRDSNLDASFRYADVWTEKLGITEGLNSLDMSLRDWQSLKASNPPEDSKENCKDAGLVDERSVLNSDMVFLSVSASAGCEDASFATFQGENNILKQGFLTDDMSVIQREALSDPNDTDSSSPILGTDSTVHFEKSSIPLRTAAMENFLQGTGKEVTDRMQLLHYQEPEAKIYNAPYMEEYQPSALLLTADKVNQSNRGKLAAFNNQEMDASNGLLPAGSNILTIDRKPDSPSFSETVERRSHAMLREDGHSELALNLNLTQEKEGAALQKTSVAEHHTRSNISESSMFGSGQWPRSDQHLESKIASSERPLMNDYQAKHFENSPHQISKTGDGVDLCKAVLNRNVKGISVNEARLMNAVSFDQVDHAQLNLQELNTLMLSQKYQTDNDVMDQVSGYLLHDPADSICSYSERRSQESSPRFSSTEKYLSNPRGLSPLSVANRPYSFETPSQTLMSPATIQEHAFSHSAHHSVSPVCTLCIQQAHAQQPQSPQNMMQHHRFPQISSMAHQRVFYDGWESPRAHHMQPESHGPSDRLSQAGSASPPARMRNKSSVLSKFRPLLPGRHRHFPPLPREGAAPYVLCQECDQLLKVPEYLPPNGGNTQKLRCGACGKISKFSIYQETSNDTRIRSSQSSNVSSEINSKIRASITPWLVQSSSACKVHPETAIARPSGYSSSFSSNDHGGRLLIPKAAQIIESPRHQRVESPRHEVVGGRTAVGSSLGSHYDRVDNQMLHQTDSSARIISTRQSFDYMYHPRSIAGIMQDQEFSRSRSRDGQGDRFLSKSGTNRRSSLSSFPPSVHGSSLLGNVSNICVEEDLKERVASGGKRMSNGVYLHSSVNDQDGQSFESNDSFWKGYNKSKSLLSAVTMQHSPRMHSTESVDNEPLGRNQLTWTEASTQWHAMGPGHSRSSSKGGTAQFRKWSTAPGSPLIEHFDGESLEFGPTLLQRDSHNGIGSAPWTPGSVSPLYDHVACDASSDFDERSHQKEHDFSSKRHLPVSQDMSRRPKYFAGLLKKGFKGGQGSNNLRKVVVNGKLISDAIVKKAEEKAGVIYPGSYWYDYRAGFWGVMGGPCLGIIPPFIEELYSPLSKDCSGGRTGILVNDRELHHKDLQLLAGRGLPTTPGKAYAVDILGNVVDDASGQQLGSLGRLAPTIEKKKSGYGMFQPSDVQSG